MVFTIQDYIILYPPWWEKIGELFQQPKDRSYYRWIIPTHPFEKNFFPVKTYQLLGIPLAPAVHLAEWRCQGLVALIMLREGMAIGHPGGCEASVETQGLDATDVSPIWYYCWIYHIVVSSWSKYQNSRIVHIGELEGKNVSSEYHYSIIVV